MLRAQVEPALSPARLAKDGYLRGLLERKPDEGVDVEVVARFKRVRKLCGDDGALMIPAALEDSDAVRVVRRKDGSVGLVPGAGFAGGEAGPDADRETRPTETGTGPAVCLLRDAPDDVRSPRLRDVFEVPAPVQFVDRGPAGTFVRYETLRGAEAALAYFEEHPTPLGRLELLPPAAAAEYWAGVEDGWNTRAKRIRVQ